ncbi:MAG: ATP-binding cassette domain-containing protein, partial [Stackebrandtia sp.]
PSGVVGAVLDAAGFNPAHTARQHLRVYSALGGHPDRRVDEVIDRLDITGFADRPTGGYSTGRRHRLHLATALLGDPRVLLLDEPANGLDPQGIAWLRGLLRDLADTGHTVLVSSHVLSEMEHTIDHVVMISHGRLVASKTIGELTENSTLENEFLRLTAHRQEASR